MLVDRTHTHFLLILYVLFHEIYWLECRFYLHQVFITFSVCIRFFGLDKQTSFNWYQSKNPFIDWRFIFLPFSYFWIVLLDSKFPQDWNIILFSIGWDLVFMFFLFNQLLSIRILCNKKFLSSNLINPRQTSMWTLWWIFLIWLDLRLKSLCWCLNTMTNGKIEWKTI